MASYKNREVEIIEELPRGDGDLVKIQHKQLGMGTEIVPISQVVVSPAEMKQIKEDRSPPDDFQVSLREVKPTGEHTIKGRNK